MRQAEHPSARSAELIVWVDPYVLDRPWNSDEVIEEKLSHMHCHTVGYIAKETDDFVVLAQGYSLKANLEDVEEWGHCWVIPKICILKRERLFTAPTTYADALDVDVSCNVFGN
jgi:hypothetical protein